MFLKHEKLIGHLLFVDFNLVDLKSGCFLLKRFHRTSHCELRSKILFPRPAAVVMRRFVFEAFNEREYFGSSIKWHCSTIVFVSPSEVLLSERQVVVLLI